MSKAFKCDHCKKCFDPLEEREGEPNLRLSLIEVLLFDPQHEQQHKFVERYERLDICPDCTQMLLDWFKFGRNKLMDTDYTREYDNWREDNGN